MRHRRILKMLVTVLGLFVVCRGPYYVTEAVIATVKATSPITSATNTFQQVTQLVLTCNSFLMPVIYSLFNTKMHDHIVDIIVTVFRRCRRIEDVGVTTTIPEVQAAKRKTTTSRRMSANTVAARITVSAGVGDHQRRQREKHTVMGAMSSLSVVELMEHEL